MAPRLAGALSPTTYVTPPRRQIPPRVMVISLVAWGTAVVALIWSQSGQPHDIDPGLFAARGLLHGLHPYDLIGPGRPFVHRHALLYPFTAILALVPLSLMPVALANLVFIIASGALLAYGLTRTQPYPPSLVLFVSLPYLQALQLSQWSPSLLAAALSGGITGGAWLACKPTIGLALFAAFPTRWLLLGAGALTAVAFAVDPWWVGSWLQSARSATHITAPILLPGGFLVALAALRWRRPEARLLLGLACVPHSIALYETVPLFLIPATWPEAWGLWALAILAQAGRLYFEPYPTYDGAILAGSQWIIWCLYLPCTALLLTRPNQANTT